MLEYSKSNAFPCHSSNSALPCRQRRKQSPSDLGLDIMVVSTPLKNMKVSWDDYSQYIMENKKMFQTTNQDIYSHIFPAFWSSNVITYHMFLHISYSYGW
jgi:hypothetical protein